MPHLTTDVARRLRQIRKEVFGEDGVPLLAEILELPAKTWENYEAGVILPATVMLQFIDVTRVAPKWLLTGDGERFLPGNGTPGLHASGLGGH